MIITSVALLVLSLVLLIVGIAKSGVAYLVLSSVSTVVACVLLYASYVHYRSKGILDGRTVSPGYPAAYDVGATPAAVPASGPRGAGFLADYERLDADSAAELAGTLNLDELHELRRFEVEHENRRSVLRAVDARINSIVAVRKSLSGAT